MSDMQSVEWWDNLVETGTFEADTFDTFEDEDDFEPEARTNPVSTGLAVVGGVAALGAIGFYARRQAQRRKLLSYLKKDPIQGLLPEADLRASANEALPIFGMNTIDEAFLAITGRERGLLDSLRQVPGVSEFVDAVHQGARNTSNRIEEAPGRAASGVRGAAAQAWDKLTFWSGSDFGDYGGETSFSLGRYLGYAMTISAMALMYHRSKSIWKTAAIGLPYVAPVYLTYRGIQYAADRAKTPE